MEIRILYYIALLLHALKRELEKKNKRSCSSTEHNSKRDNNNNNKKKKRFSELKDNFVKLRKMHSFFKFPHFCRTVFRLLLCVSIKFDSLQGRNSFFLKRRKLAVASVQPSREPSSQWINSR